MFRLDIRKTFFNRRVIQPPKKLWRPHCPRQLWASYPGIFQDCCTFDTSVLLWNLLGTEHFQISTLVDHILPVILTHVDLLIKCPTLSDGQDCRRNSCPQAVPQITGSNRRQRRKRGKSSYCYGEWRSKRYRIHWCVPSCQELYHRAEAMQPPSLLSPLDDDRMTLSSTKRSAHFQNHILSVSQRVIYYILLKNIYTRM